MQRLHRELAHDAGPLCPDADRRRPRGPTSADDWLESDGRVIEGCAPLCRDPFGELFLGEPFPGEPFIDARRGWPAAIAAAVEKGLGAGCGGERVWRLSLPSSMPARSRDSH